MGSNREVLDAAARCERVDDRRGGHVPRRELERRVHSVRAQVVDHRSGRARPAGAMRPDRVRGRPEDGQEALDPPTDGNVDRRGAHEEDRRRERAGAHDHEPSVVGARHRGEGTAVSHRERRHDLADGHGLAVEHRREDAQLRRRRVGHQRSVWHCARRSCQARGELFRGDIGVGSRQSLERGVHPERPADVTCRRVRVRRPVVRGLVRVVGGPLVERVWGEEAGEVGRRSPRGAHPPRDHPGEGVHVPDHVAVVVALEPQDRVREPSPAPVLVGDVVQHHPVAEVDELLSPHRRCDLARRGERPRTAPRYQGPPNRRTRTMIETAVA